MAQNYINSAEIKISTTEKKKVAKQKFFLIYMISLSHSLKLISVFSYSVPMVRFILTTSFVLQFILTVFKLRMVVRKERIYSQEEQSWTSRLYLYSIT